MGIPLPRFRDQTVAMSGGAELLLQEQARIAGDHVRRGGRIPIVQDSGDGSAVRVCRLMELFVKVIEVVMRIDDGKGSLLERVSIGAQAELFFGFRFGGAMTIDK